METMNNQRLNELEEKGLFNLTDEEILEYGKLIKDTNQLDKDWDIHPHSLKIFNSLPMSLRCGGPMRKLQKILKK